MEDLRVPKHRVAAEVLLPGGASRRIALFLAEAASTHAGPERPSDLLNGGEDFVPALDDASGNMTFLNRAAIAVVRVARELEVDDAAETTIPTEHEVEALLADDTVLHGLVSYVLPADHARLRPCRARAAEGAPLVDRAGAQPRGVAREEGRRLRARDAAGALPRERLRRPQGRAQGMQTLNDALVELVKKKVIEPREALVKAVAKAELRTLLERAGVALEAAA